jgi:hypothetical protein
MSTGSQSRSAGLLTRFFSRLKFPWLFGIFVTLLGFDLLLPDVIPIADELLLGLMTLLLGAWKDRKRTAVIDAETIHRHDPETGLSGQAGPR